MGFQTTYPGSDYERIIPSELRLDDGTSDSPSEDEDAAKSQGGDDDS